MISRREISAVGYLVYARHAGHFRTQNHGLRRGTRAALRPKSRARE